MENQDVYVPQVGEIVRVVVIDDNGPKCHQVGDIQRFNQATGLHVGRHPSKPVILLHPHNGKGLGTWCRVEKWVPKAGEMCRGKTLNKGMEKQGQYIDENTYDFGRVAILSSGKVSWESLEPVGMLKPKEEIMTVESGRTSSKKNFAERIKEAVNAGVVDGLSDSNKQKTWEPRQGEEVRATYNGRQVTGAFQRWISCGVGSFQQASVWYGGHAVTMTHIGPIKEEAEENKMEESQEFYGTMPAPEQLPTVLPEGTYSNGDTNMSGWVLCNTPSRGVHYAKPGSSGTWNGTIDVCWRVRRVRQAQPEFVDEAEEGLPTKFMQAHSTCGNPYCKKNFVHPDPSVLYCSADCHAEALRQEHLTALDNRGHIEAVRQRKICAGAPHYQGHDLSAEATIMSRMLMDGRHKKTAGYGPKAEAPGSQHPVAWPEGSYDDAQELYCS